MLFLIQTAPKRIDRYLNILALSLRRVELLLLGYEVPERTNSFLPQDYALIPSYQKHEEFS